MSTQWECGKLSFYKSVLHLSNAKVNENKEMLCEAGCEILVCISSMIDDNFDYNVFNYGMELTEDVDNDNILDVFSNIIDEIGSHAYLVSDHPENIKDIIHLLNTLFLILGEEMKAKWIIYLEKGIKNGKTKI